MWLCGRSLVLLAVISRVRIQISIASCCRLALDSEFLQSAQTSAMPKTIRIIGKETVGGGIADGEVGLFAE